MDLCDMISADFLNCGACGEPVALHASPGAQYACVCGHALHTTCKSACKCGAGQAGRRDVTESKNTRLMSRFASFYTDQLIHGCKTTGCEYVATSREALEMHQLFLCTRAKSVAIEMLQEEASQDTARTSHVVVCAEHRCEMHLEQAAYTDSVVFQTPIVKIYLDERYIRLSFYATEAVVVVQGPGVIRDVVMWAKTPVASKNIVEHNFPIWPCDLTVHVSPIFQSHLDLQRAASIDSCKLARSYQSYLVRCIRVAMLDALKSEDRSLSLPQPVQRFVQFPDDCVLFMLRARLLFKQRLLGLLVYKLHTGTESFLDSALYFVDSDASCDRGGVFYAVLDIAGESHAQRIICGHCLAVFDGVYEYAAHQDIPMPELFTGSVLLSAPLYNAVQIAPDLQCARHVWACNAQLELRPYTFRCNFTHPPRPPPPHRHVDTYYGKYIYANGSVMRSRLVIVGTRCADDMTDAAKTEYVCMICGTLLTTSDGSSAQNLNAMQVLSAHFALDSGAIYGMQQMCFYRDDGCKCDCYTSGTHVLFDNRTLFTEK